MNARNMSEPRAAKKVIVRLIAVKFFYGKVAFLVGGWEN